MHSHSTTLHCLQTMRHVRCQMIMIMIAQIGAFDLDFLILCLFKWLKCVLWSRNYLHLLTFWIFFRIKKMFRRFMISLHVFVCLMFNFCIKLISSGRSHFTFRRCLCFPPTFYRSTIAGRFANVIWYGVHWNNKTAIKWNIMEFYIIKILQKEKYVLKTKQHRSVI